MSAAPVFNFSGKSVLVTGSNSGIGLATAEAFAKAGANIALNSFSDTAEDHDLAKNLARDYSVESVYIPADLADPEACRAAVEVAQTAFGTIDILINNAGIQHISPVETFENDAWARVTDINLNAQFHTIKAALPAMKENGWGRIINVASAHGLHASANKSAYIAAKHGVVGLSKTVALETAEQGITCNAVCPGYVFTPIIEKQIPDIMRQTNLDESQVIRDVLLVKQPTKTFIEMNEVADTILFLASDAAKSITGTALSIDGGWSAI